jgi:hypothetical protein
MESSSYGGIPTKSSVFIAEHMLQHGAGMDENAFTTVRQGLSKIKPVDESQLFLLTDEDFGFFVSSGIGASFICYRTSTCA